MLSRLVDVQGVRDYDGPGLYLFLGISTAGSSVHDTFPLWAPLFAPGSELRGVDLPEDAAPEVFRELVTAMRNNPRVHGAVVTSHKLRLHRAIADLIDHCDPLVDLTHEINGLDTRSGIRAFARDPQSLDLVLDMTAVAAPTPRRPILCIGAGGSAIALLLAMGLDLPASLGAGHPVRSTSGRGPLTIVGRSQRSLDEVQQVKSRAGLDDADVRFELAPTSDDVAALVARMTAGGIIANATGLGKIGPGSPLESAAFPPGVIAWDFNYRGPLTFLAQARAAGVHTEDGWDYFLAGWSAALAAITGRDLTGELFDAVRNVSASLRPRGFRAG